MLFIMVPHVIRDVIIYTSSYELNITFVHLFNMFKVYSKRLILYAVLIEDLGSGI